ncbi:MAG: 50S ribosomal protein L24 [Patescibacteria group bacterium]
MKIHKNDTIKIITGKDKGRSGKVLKIFPEKGKVLVEGLNLYKKHVRPKKQGEKGQIISVPRPINSSNVMLICSSCNRTARTGYRFENDNKIRICKKCEAKL